MKHTITLLLICLSHFAHTQDGVRVYLEKPNALMKSTAIFFVEGSTDGVDNCCDALLFGGPLNNIYTYNGNVPYVINTFAPLNDDTEIQLGMTINPDTGLFIVGIDQWYGDTLHALLLDNLVAGLHELPYVCYSPVSNDRFKLRFEYPMCVEVYSGCERGLITIDNDDEGAEYLLIFGNDTMSYPQNIDTIQNLSEGVYTLISGSGESYTFGIETTPFDEASLYVSSDNVLLIDSWIEFILTCNVPETQVEWNFGDGVIQIGDYNPVHHYTEPGIYTASVKLTSFNGCQKTLSQLITVSYIATINRIEKTRFFNTQDSKWMIDGKQIR